MMMRMMYYIQYIQVLSKISETALAEERLEQHKLHKLAGSPTMRQMGTVGVGQFFSAEKLAVAARKEEVNDIVWTNQQKAKYWGGGEVEQAQNFRQAFCAPWQETQRYVYMLSCVMST